MESSELIRACRPKQWTKNLLVFAAPFFAFRIDPDVWFDAVWALVAFCMISSAIYLLNDSIDAEADRKHLRKCYRPIAARLLSVPTALTASGLLAVVSLTIAAAISTLLAAVILAYGLIQVAYCLRLKREPLLDLVCIASGFLLRAMAGGVAAGLTSSPWFLLTVGLLALFLAVEKRKAELTIAEGSGVMTRQVLERYSMPLLIRLEGLASTSAFMSYSLWAAGPALDGASTTWMLLTVPFVLIGIFRYQLLSDPDEAQRRLNNNSDRTAERPEAILVSDRGMRLTLLSWLLTTALIIMSTN